MENVVVFLVCIISGIFTGLLGIGGGLIIVPAFLVILPLFNITTISTHEIIGISSTVVLLNSLAGLFYRRGEEYLEKKFLIKSTIFIILGTIISAYFSSFAPIKPIFGLYCLVALTSIYLIKKDVYFDFKLSSSISGAGRMSSRVLTICPNLTKVGPSSSQVTRMRLQSVTLLSGLGMRWRKNDFGL